MMNCVFLLVESVVPKSLKSSHFDIAIYDDRGALIPIHGLPYIIRTRINFENFHLKIHIGKKNPNSNEAKVKNSFTTMLTPGINVFSLSDHYRSYEDILLRTI